MTLPAPWSFARAPGSVSADRKALQHSPTGPRLDPPATTTMPAIDKADCIGEAQTPSNSGAAPKWLTIGQRLAAPFGNRSLPIGAVSVDWRGFVA